MTDTDDAKSLRFATIVFIVLVVIGWKLVTVSGLAARVHGHLFSAYVSFALLAIPIWLGGFSFLEAYHKTCVQLAIRDEQSLDDSFVMSKTLRGDKVQDENMKRALHDKARKITLELIALAIPLTALLVLIP